MQSDFYWSGTSSADIPSAGWSVHLDYSYVDDVFKVIGAYAWPVRSGEQALRCCDELARLPIRASNCPRREYPARCGSRVGRHDHPDMGTDVSDAPEGHLSPFGRRMSRRIQDIWHYIFHCASCIFTGSSRARTRRRSLEIALGAGLPPPVG